MPTLKSLRPAATFGLVSLLFSLSSAALAQSEKTSYKFDFGSGKTESGYTQVLPEMVYSKDRGFGFEPGANVAAVDRGGNDALRDDLIYGDTPFQFSVALAEGNYKVSVTLGDSAVATNTTVKAELRRLMVEGLKTEAGKFETRIFNVNIRTPQFPGGEVRLKDREKAGEAKAWDDKLTLEFDGSRPSVCAIEISKIESIPVIYLCGDSTVCDQPGESYASWGQMLTRFLKPDVVVASHAESGESLRGFLGEKRWDKVMSLLKPGDYVLIQMGHNDEKDRFAGAGAFTSFKTDLKRFVADARSKKATPIIITPMERRGFDGAKVRMSHGDYPEAVRQVAKEDNVALIDLHTMSIKFYEALGPQRAPLAFAGSGDRRDTTHQDNYGAYELAKCILIGIQENKLDLAKSIVDDFKGFDPAHPDDVDTFSIPAGPSRNNQVPLGS